MSKNYLALAALIGGGIGALDRIDGALLNDGDAAQVTIAGGVYNYHLNAASGAAENSPYVIAPDTNPGTKRWVLVTPVGAFSHVKAKLSTGQSIVSGSATLVIFDTEEQDTLSEYSTSTGVFTAVYAGEYSVNAALRYNTAAWSNGENSSTQVFKESALYRAGMTHYAQSSASYQLNTSISTTVTLAVGETIDIRGFHNQGAAISLAAIDLNTWLTIDRLM